MTRKTHPTFVNKPQFMIGPQAWNGRPMPQRLYMPDDLVVVANLDSDEAGDYRVMRHGDAIGNPNWKIMPDMIPSDLD